jgi:flagellar assembly factor FliW
MDMKHTNRQFGVFEYDEKHVVEFPDGIIGFETNKRYVIVSDEETDPFRWLISLDDEDLSFPILEPAHLIPYYSSMIDRSDDVSIFVVAALTERLEDCTVNLRSPIVIDNKTQRGEQLIVADDSLSMRFPLAPRQNAGTEE